MKIAMTPRFFENGHDQLLAIERKYYPFFEKFDCRINLVPFSGISMDQYLKKKNLMQLFLLEGIDYIQKRLVNLRSNFYKKF